MKIDLTEYQCTELEITGDIEMPDALQRELLAVAEKENQLEDSNGIFFHEDYLVGESTHHSDIRLEEIGERDQLVKISMFYALVGPQELERTPKTPDYLVSRVTDSDAIAFDCRCSFNVEKEVVTGTLSSLPLKVSIAKGEMDVIYKGVYLTLQEGGKDVYDLLLRVMQDEKLGEVYEFTFTFRHEEHLSLDLPQNALTIAKGYLDNFVSA